MIMQQSVVNDPFARNRPATSTTCEQYTKMTDLSAEEVAMRIKQLRSLVLGHEELTKRRHDDVYLLRYLNKANFAVDLAFQKMKDLYGLIVDYNNYFSIKSPLECKKLIEQNLKLMIEGQDRDGRILYLARLGTLNVNEVSFKDLIHLSSLWMELILDTPQSQNSGMSLIIDVQHIPWSIVKFLNNNNLKIGCKLFDLTPTRQIRIHIVNPSFLFYGVLKLVWPLLPASMKEVITIHSKDYISLHECISPEYLPPDYGGKAPALNYALINQALYDKDAEIGTKLKQLLYI